MLVLGLHWVNHRLGLWWHVIKIFFASLSALLQMHILRRCILCIQCLHLRAALWICSICKITARALCTVKPHMRRFLAPNSPAYSIFLQTSINVHVCTLDHVRPGDVHASDSGVRMESVACPDRAACAREAERRGFAHLAHAVCVNSTHAAAAAAAKGAPSTRQTHPEEKMLSTNAQVHSKELEMSLACASRNKWPDREKIFFISFKGKSSMLWNEFETKCFMIKTESRLCNARALSSCLSISCQTITRQGNCSL